MRTRSIFALMVVAVLTACGPQRSPVAATQITTNWFVTQFGEHHSKDGAWRVVASAADHTLELAREWSPDRVAALNRDNILAFSVHGATNAYRTDGWRAQAGWFVFVEHDARAWCYDGAEFLWLLQIAPNGSSGSYGPRCFPSPVPQQVLARLTDATRNAVVKENP